MKFGNRASLEAIPRKTVDVEFPEFDTVYRLREMSGTERDDHEIAALRNASNGSGTASKIELKFLRARLVTYCLVDENGDRIYSDKEIKQCSELPQSVLLKLFTAANELNGMAPDSVEDAAKNSESDLEEDLSSGSLSDSAKPSLNS